MEQDAVSWGPPPLYFQEGSLQGLPVAIHRHLTSHRNRFPTVCIDTYRACCQVVLGSDPIQQH